jgi:hypothetical protein
MTDQRVTSAARRRLPDRRGCETFELECNGQRYLATVSHFRDGTLGEIFLNSVKLGSAIDTAARDSAIMCSLLLQHGAGLDTIRKALCRDARGNASGPLGAALDMLAGQT